MKMKRKEVILNLSSTEFHIRVRHLWVAIKLK